MPGKKVLYFTEKDMEFTDLLIRIGLQRTVATGTGIPCKHF